MIVNTPRGPKPRTEASGASPAPAAGTAPANPVHAPPANGQGGSPKPASSALSAKFGSLPDALTKLAGVKISPSPAETPPTSLAPPTEAATPQAIDAATGPEDPTANGNEAPANTPAPVAAAAPPTPAPLAPEAIPGPTPDPSGTNPAAQAPPPEAEEPPPATSQSGSAAAQPKPPSSNKPAAPAPPAAPEPEEEDERDPHRREKELVAAGVRLALGDPGVRQALLASFGGEVSRLLERELKPIQEKLQAAPRPAGATQQEVATIGTRLRDHMDTRLEELRSSLVTEITAKLAELGRPATAEDVHVVVENATTRVEQQLHDVGKAINDHTDVATQAASDAVNAATEGHALALGGQIDAAKAAANEAKTSADTAASRAEETASNLLGVGRTLEQVKDRAQEAATAADQVVAGANRVADQLAGATRALATFPAPAANPGTPLPTALGGGIGTSPVVGAGPAGQTVVAAGNPIPAPPPADMHALHGPARDYQNVKVLVGGVIAIVSVLLAIIFL